VQLSFSKIEQTTHPIGIFNPSLGLWILNNNLCFDPGK
jgi:hypothetical protein